MFSRELFPTSNSSEASCAGPPRRNREKEQKPVSAASSGITARTNKMAAISAIAPVLNKAPVVSTGKAANTNSMMVWQPHGNK